MHVAFSEFQYICDTGGSNAGNCIALAEVVVRQSLTLRTPPPLGSCFRPPAAFFQDRIITRATELRWDVVASCVCLYCLFVCVGGDEDGRRGGGRGWSGVAGSVLLAMSVGVFGSCSVLVASNGTHKYLSVFVLLFRRR